MLEVGISQLTLYPYIGKQLERELNMTTNRANLKTVCNYSWLDSDGVRHHAVVTGLDPRSYDMYRRDDVVHPADHNAELFRQARAQHTC